MTFQSITLFGTGDPKLMAGGDFSSSCDNSFGFGCGHLLFCFFIMCCLQSLKILFADLKKRLWAFLLRRSKSKIMFVDIILFLEKGGKVLWLIFFSLFCLWVLIMERYWFLFKIYPIKAKEKKEKWMLRKDNSSWMSLKVRLKEISQMERELIAVLFRPLNLWLL